MAKDEMNNATPNANMPTRRQAMRTQAPNAASNAAHQIPRIDQVPGAVRMAPQGQMPNQGSMPQGQMPNAQFAQPAQPKHKGRTVIIVLACVLLALVVWLCIWLFACNGQNMFDANARDGQAPYKTAEEIQAELDRVVEEGMFNISIAGAIQFDDGTSPGKAYIENVPGNHYLMQVSIIDEDTEETLYESGVLKPNQYIEDITLTRDLDAGTYPAVAVFTALDPDNYNDIGRAQAKVTLNVLS